MLKLNRRIQALLILCLLLIASCSPQSQSSQNVDLSIDDSACAELVDSALESVDRVCTQTGANQLCYGNIDLRVEAQPGVDALAMESPGDMADFADIRRIELSPMDSANEAWGVALMRLQAMLPDALPGQNVTFLLFGDVQVDNQGQTSAGSPQAFHIESGIGDAPCEGAPDSGMLVQTPAGTAAVTFTINAVEVALGSTAYFQAQAGDTLRVSVLEGQATVTADDITQQIAAGNSSQVELDANGIASGPPSPPEPYDSGAVVALPVDHLDQAVPLVSVALHSRFVDDAEDWTFFADATNFEHVAADETADGYICASDRSTGVYWYFQAPETWLGDQRDAYGGTLNYVIRQAATSAPGDAPDILLRGEEQILQYDTAYDPAITWTAYSVPLVANAGWLLLDNNENLISDTPTAAQMQAVLGTLSAIHIRGEYQVGSDSACLDSVQISKTIASSN